MSSTFRERSRGSFGTAGSCGYTSHTGVNYYTTQAITGSKETFKDVVTKDFRKRRANGEVIMNPYQKLKVSYEAATISDSWSYTTPYTTQVWKSFGCRAYDQLQTQSWGAGGIPFPYILSQSEKDALVLEVSTRVLSQRQRSNTDMWENLAELHKTAGMVAKPIASWFKWHRKYAAVTAAMSSANAWLMYRYGISPLISTVDGLLVEYFRNVRPLRVTTRAKGSISAQGSDTHTFVDGSHIITYGIQKTAKYSIRAMSLDEASNDMLTRYGFGAKSLLTLPWELVPYSFVVDWCFNVGDYLGSLAGAFFPKSLGQCTTDLWEFREKRTSLSETGTGTTVITREGKWSATCETLLGGRFPGPLESGVVVKNDFRLDKLTRLGDSLALIGQIILRRFSPK